MGIGLAHPPTWGFFCSGPSPAFSEQKTCISYYCHLKFHHQNFFRRIILKIYVASSWRNSLQPEICNLLREAGHQVYDFRDPEDNGSTGFHWSDIDRDWELWSPADYKQGLDHILAAQGFKKDFDAMKWCDAMVLVMPCGRSAHLELGWAVGAGKRTAILLDDGEPELMNKMVDRLCSSVEEMLDWL
jgi:hypothetical protein